MNKHLVKPLTVALLVTASSIGIVRAAQQVEPYQTISPQVFEAGETTPDGVDPVRPVDQAQAASSDVERSNSVTAIAVCVNLPDWERPSEQVQQKQLQGMPRYGAALQDEPLLSLTKEWWNHEVFSFTTYGLSARTDPHYLSGVWTALDSLWDCYAGEQPQRINEGELAELWLINHQLVEILWLDNHYQVIVEPRTSGLQLVQFERQETMQQLPINIVTTDGASVAVMSGDW